MDHTFQVWQVTNFLSLEEATQLARDMSKQFHPYLLKRHHKGRIRYAVVREGRDIPTDWAVLVTSSELVEVR